MKTISPKKCSLICRRLLGSYRFPERIECFDTSNIAGTDLVASMVAFTHGKYDKKRTRLFKIRDIPKGDDYAALHQVISRRLTRAKEENDLPDLIVVDGGKGQLTLALAVLKELDIATVDLISVAKQEGKHDKGLTQEKIFRPGNPTPFCCPSILPSCFSFSVSAMRPTVERSASIASGAEKDDHVAH